MVVADVDERGGRDTVAAIDEAGGSSHFVRTDVSRLADLCRVRLVARDLPQAAAAVAAACGDSAVRVAGVKNGMTLGHSAALHAGFRVRPPPPAGPVHSITPLPDYNPHGPSVLV